MQLDRRKGCWWLVAAGAALGGCAGLFGYEAVRVNVVGVDPLPGEGMEVRMAVKLRVQNPNDIALEYDGIALDLDVRGAPFASGVSSERGTIARYGEALITVPVSISTLAVLRQVIGLAGGENRRIDYALRGRLGGTGLGGVRFASSGQIDLPSSIGVK